MGLIKKFFGWILLFLGLVTIFWSLYSSYNIFIGTKEPPQIFKIEKEESLSKTEKSTLEERLKRIVSEKVGEQLKAMIPPGALPKLLNLMAWSMLAFILIFGGTQIATLGIRLIK